MDSKCVSKQSATDGSCTCQARDGRHEFKADEVWLLLTGVHGQAKRPCIVEYTIVPQHLPGKAPSASLHGARASVPLLHLDEHEVSALAAGLEADVRRLLAGHQLRRIALLQLRLCRGGVQAVEGRAR